MNGKLLEYRISHITIRESIMGGFDRVGSTECRWDPHRATFSHHQHLTIPPIKRITDRCRYQTLLNYPEVLGVHLHLSITLTFDPEHVWRRDSGHIPPDDPPHESSWFTGFKVVPMMLLTVSPSCEGSSA